MNNFYSKYKVLCKIGEGSFSEVLKCEQKLTRRRFAAKRLKRLYKNFESVKYCSELLALRQVPYHPNILNVVEYFYDPVMYSLIFVFELMDMSMYEFLKARTRPLPEVKVKHFLFQILKGVCHLHKYGIFHRDIKPENILIKFSALVTVSQTSHFQGELIKIGDLGSVRGFYSSQPYTEYISTRWYRSPECLLTAGHYGPKMDIWAIGCVFYEMLTPLFPGVNELDQLAKIHYILGTPDAKFFTRLKSKSRNCICFPKFAGIGLDLLLTKFTKECRTVLKLMLEYNSDHRPNVRYILRNVYFKEFFSTESRPRRSSESQLEDSGKKYMWRKFPSTDALNRPNPERVCMLRPQQVLPKATSLVWSFRRSQTVEIQTVKKPFNQSHMSKFSSH